MKIGPNDPCSCGSEKKYKKCCFAKDLAAQGARAAEHARDAEAAAAAPAETSTTARGGQKNQPKNRGKGTGAARSSAPRRRAV